MNILIYFNNLFFIFLELSFNLFAILHDNGIKVQAGVSEPTS